MSRIVRQLNLILKIYLNKSLGIFLLIINVDKKNEIGDSDSNSIKKFIIIFMSKKLNKTSFSTCNAKLDIIQLR